jgi:hypothetical protein
MRLFSKYRRVACVYSFLWISIIGCLPAYAERIYNTRGEQGGGSLWYLVVIPIGLVIWVIHDYLKNTRQGQYVSVWIEAIAKGGFTVFVIVELIAMIISFVF